MLNLSISVSGLDEIRQKLGSFDVERVLGDSIEQAADQLVIATQNMPPVNVKNDGYGAIGIPVAPLYGGTMRQSIHTIRTGPLEAEVKADTDYAGYVHWGTSKMQARPFFQWMLDYFQGYETIEAVVTDALKLWFGQ